MNEVDELAIILTARMDELQTGINKATGLLEDFSKKSNKKGEEGGEGFVKMAAKVGITVVALRQFIVQTALAAAEVQALDTALIAVSDNLGINEEAVRSNKEAIAALGYDDNAAISVLMRFTKANIDQKKSLDLARVAMDIADSSGKGYSETLDLLSRAVVTGNARALRQFEILGSTDAALKSYAQTHHKSVEELTEHDKRLATLNIIMERANIVTGVHEKVMGTAGGKIKLIAEQTAKASDNIGGLFVPSLDRLATAALKVLEGFNKIAETKFWKHLTGVITTASKNIIPGLGILTELVAGPEAKPDKETPAAQSNRRKKAQDAANDDEEVFKKSTDTMGAYFQDTMATAFASQFSLFKQGAFDMGKVFESVIDQMVQKIITAGILDLVGLLFGGPAGGFAIGNIGKLFGFDNPTNDRMAFASGGKWFQDALQNFSDGYVDRAINSPQSAQVMGQAAMASSQSSTVINVSMPAMLVTQSPAERRKTGIEIGNIIKQTIGSV